MGRLIEDAEHIISVVEKAYATAGSEHGFPKMLKTKKDGCLSFKGWGKVSFEQAKRVKILAEALEDIIETTDGNELRSNAECEACNIAKQALKEAENVD